MSVRQDLSDGVCEAAVSTSRGLVAYRCAGEETGELPVVFIHGWGGSSRYFQPVMQRLAVKRRCLAPDLPGFGNSPMPEAVHAETFFTHRGLACVVAEWLEVLNVERCHVIGHSFGAGVAIALAAMQPQRVHRVVLCNFSTFRNEIERRLIVLMHEISSLLLKLRPLRLARSDAFAYFLGRRFFYHLPDRAVLREGLDDFWRMNPRAAHCAMRYALNWETPADLRSLRQPLLLIHSHHDQIMPPRNATFTASLAPRGQLFWLDECGHLPMVEKPEAFLDVVMRFLDSA
ncbi:MAG: alpha/beta hydrolase [Thermoflexales bacterium]|nr:alpha/beta hydrolase [Thermoflexales bacterium]MCS7324377.1 alpha/beta hydrolase [Thermoflexales bacterium]MCX7938735.1 alpha/beta hydrolase [Thermoflexales bacterium]MDW8053298.1 alpha/beta hydrolase [Anaerolineae bacterium]MDW8291949.1 alpha/beta hydrolase [Anaerolineae bacterium]